MSEAMDQIKIKIDKEWPDLSDAAKNHLYNIAENFFDLSKEVFGKPPSESKIKAFISQIFSILHLGTVQD